MNGRNTTAPAGGRRDLYAWRLVGTALSFTTFGLAGLLLGGIALPLSRLVPLSPQRRRQFGGRVVSASFRVFVRVMHVCRLLTYEIRGRERLGRPGQLILANHPSLVDVVFLIGFTPRAGCVVKAAFWRNPFTRGVVASAGYVPNAPTDEMVEGAARALEEGQALIMFPEGTRTTPGQPLDFQRGAAVVALRAARVITPVYITVDPTTLTKREPWYRIPIRRPHFSLVVGEDIDPGPFRDGRPPPRAGRALNALLIRHFAERVAITIGERSPP
jgi:1-acyl-sn-glycerol-3-phosphate acyltransferase